MVEIPPDFVSDGCTWFPDIWRGIDLSQCCRVHDFNWFTNTTKDFSAWLVSNVDLSFCFAGAGAWELFVPSLAATSTIGFLLFYVFRKAKENLRPVL